MMKFDFGYWSSVHLIDIAKKGFDALNISIGAHHINALAEEAAGSPQLMQSLCLHLCLELDITKKRLTKESIIVNQSALEKTFFRVSQTADHSHAVNKIADGPKLEAANENIIY